MITKIKHLKGVGKFYQFSSQANELNWGSQTFILAPNAYGKSTLVSVLRSLRDNDPVEVKARRTLTSKTPPEAVVEIAGEDYAFNGSRWTRPFPSVQIFDAPFIQQNILGYEIGHEHKKNIHRIIVGQRGVQLAEELADLKAREKTAGQTVSTLADRFKALGMSVSLQEFLAIPVSEQAAATARIADLEGDIRTKGSEDVVRRLALPDRVTPPLFDLSALRATVMRKSQAVHAAAKNRVLSHIKRNFKDQAQAVGFIRQGLDEMHQDCPFCGQGLDAASTLIEAYRQFFDDSHRLYQQALDHQIVALEKWNLENELTAVVSKYNSNLAIIQQWDPYLSYAPLEQDEAAAASDAAPSLPDLAEVVETRRSRLIGAKDAVRSELGTKKANTNHDADTAQMHVLCREMDELAAAIDLYNRGLALVVEGANDYVARLPKLDIDSMKAALKSARETAVRFEPDWRSWASAYHKAQEAACDLRTKRDAKQSELEEYSKGVFVAYQGRINQLLTDLGADFQVSDMTGKTDQRARESYTDFGLSILDRTVPLAARASDSACLRNTLSEGDKSTLAFAFFLAALERNPQLADQTVLLDDPLSSLDDTRREATARLLLRLSASVGQLVVLTHKKDFLFMLCDKMPGAKAIRVRSDRASGSWLEPLDVEEERKGEHARRVETMERYLEADFGPTPETMQGSIRKVFEVVLKTKYYRRLTTEIKANKGLKVILRRLFQLGKLDVALRPTLLDLCNLTNDPHHGDIVDAPARTLTRDELIPLIRDSLDMVERV